MNESQTNQLAEFQIQIEITWIFEYDIYIMNGQQTCYEWILSIPK